MSLLSFGKKNKTEPAINLTAEMAKRCLSMPEFKSYKDQFDNMERKIIDEMVQDAAVFISANDDVGKFGTKCLVRLTRIRDLRALLSKVQSDARKSDEKEAR